MILVNNNYYKNLIQTLKWNTKIIDHVFIYDKCNYLTNISVEIIESDVSDHNAVLMKF